MQKNSFNILYEDREILVCSKPHGIPVQSRRIGTPDMESMLKNHLARQGQEPYLAVIHRLDQPVSGLLVFAKTKKSAASLNAQLTGSSFGKYYRALTEEIPSVPSGTLRDYIVRDGRTNTSRICSPDTPGAKKRSLHTAPSRKKRHFSRTGLTARRSWKSTFLRAVTTRSGCRWHTWDAPSWETQSIILPPGKQAHGRY